MIIPDPMFRVLAAVNTAYETNLPKATADGSKVKAGLEIVIGIAAAIAVLMIMVAGFRFIAGQANPQEVSKARNTIIYAMVGLIVAMSAEAIVAFTLGNL